MRLPLGPLRYLFGAPELHHFHHARVERTTKNFGNLAAGQWATTVIIFSSNKNPSGAKRTLTVAGTYNGGTFSDNWNVKLP